MIKGRIIVALIIIALIYTSGAAQAQSIETSAPLGLRWGASVEDVKAEGIELKEFANKEYGASFIATKLNKTLADQNGVLLSFGLNNKLWRIVAISRDYANDPNGGAVLSRYTELIEALAEKYGRPKSVHRLGGSIYAEPRYFVSGIRGGETHWYSNFKNTDLQIQLALTASDSSTAAWRLIYEYIPLSKIFESSKKNSEKEKL